MNRIVAITGRPKTSVYFHIRDVKLPADVKRRIAERSTLRLIKFNRSRKGKSARGRHPNEFTSWNADLVCLVSHFLFDGEIRYGGCVYTNRSTTLLNRVERLMRSVYDHPPKRIEASPGVYRISYHNVELAAYLRGRAKELLQRIPTAPREWQRAFLSSFFDDEGSVYFIGTKRRVRGYQHSFEMLTLIHELLQKFRIESTLDRKYNEVTISRRENIERFAREINFSPGVRINGQRSNSIWKRSLEKRKILRRAIASYQR